MPEVLGLDIGGANLKAAHTRGDVRTVPFELWKRPWDLTAALRDLAEKLPPYDLLAVTMTGELCDCFASKREGVDAILDSVEALAGRVPVGVWTTHGQFLPLKEARQEPLRVAAANWLALATLAGRFAPEGPGVLLDIGSTTTDIVELHKGRPVPSAWTDVERLRCGELVYTGVRRTPVCALLGPLVAAELFATTLDAYLLLDYLPEDPDSNQTADGKPATKAWAHIRLARMLGGDGETVPPEETRRLAQIVIDRQVELIAAGLAQVVGRMPDKPRLAVISGSGAFLGPLLLGTMALTPMALADQLGPALSEAAGAYAVAVLAKEGRSQADACRNTSAL